MLFVPYTGTKPHLATEGAAGADLVCAERTSFEGQSPSPPAYLMPTGVRVAIPKYHVGILALRSSLCREGFMLANGIGVIDSDYRGEIMVPLVYTGEGTYTIDVNERIAQLIIMPVPPVTYVAAPSLDETKRGEGGFGHTGRI